MAVLGEGRSSEIDRLECVEVFGGCVFHRWFFTRPEVLREEAGSDRCGDDRSKIDLSRTIYCGIVPQKVKAQWLDRKTQIVPAEMLAPIIALSTFESRLVGCDVLLFVDSEAVEAALVKGYSSKSDLYDLIEIFWDLVFKLRIRVFIDRVATDV